MSPTQKNLIWGTKSDNNRLKSHYSVQWRTLLKPLIATELRQAAGVTLGHSKGWVAGTPWPPTNGTRNSCRVPWPFCRHLPNAWPAASLGGRGGGGGGRKEGGGLYPALNAQRSPCLPAVWPTTGWVGTKALGEIVEAALPHLKIDVHFWNWAFSSVCWTNTPLPICNQPSNTIIQHQEEELNRRGSESPEGAGRGMFLAPWVEHHNPQAGSPKRYQPPHTVRPAWAKPDLETKLWDGWTAGNVGSAPGSQEWGSWFPLLLPYTIPSIAVVLLLGNSPFPEVVYQNPFMGHVTVIKSLLASSCSTRQEDKRITTFYWRNIFFHSLTTKISCELHTLPQFLS